MMRLKSGIRSVRTVAKVIYPANSGVVRSVFFGECLQVPINQDWLRPGITNPRDKG